MKKKAQHKTKKNLNLPVDADILKVAGFPLTTGSGDMSTPLTLTAYSPFLSTPIVNIENPKVSN